VWAQHVGAQCVALGATDGTAMQHLHIRRRIHTSSSLKRWRDKPLAQFNSCAKRKSDRQSVASRQPMCRA
jgi:hypothetical protein